MGFTVDEIGVDIIARMPKLGAGLRQAEAAVDRSAQRMDMSMGKIGKGIFGGMMKGAGVVAGIHAAEGATRNLYTNILDVQAGTLKWHEAIIDSVHGLFDSIPVLNTIHQLGQNLSPWTYKRLKDERETTKELEKQAATLARMQTKYLGVVSTNADIDNFEKLARLESTAGTEKGAGVKRSYAIIDLIDEFDELAKQIRKNYTDPAAAQEKLKQLQKAYDLKRADVEVQYQKDLDALKSPGVSGPGFFPQNTAIGMWNVPNATGGMNDTPTESTQKKMANDTKRAADALDSINKKAVPLNFFRR